MDSNLPDLDRLDRQLLDLVQHDASLTADQLAGRVPLSPSAIQRRLRRLREEGVIAREVAVIDPARVGGTTSFITSLELEHERPDQMDALRRWLATEPAVQEAFYVTGDADFILVVTVPDTTAYDSLMNRLLTAHPNVRRFTTRVALNVVKRTLALPLT